MKISVANTSLRCLPPLDPSVPRGGRCCRHATGPAKNQVVFVMDVDKTHLLLH